jgi:organic radical activating enzyme
MNGEMQSVGKFKKELDNVGHGFCLAKWTQVTIHLQMGQTHSCHHPSTHKIPISELKRNPSALHNTKFKKLRRKEMLEGERPKECDYCWKVEDNSNEFSDRIWKSHEPWSKPYLQEIKDLGWRGDYNPKYVEVAFSNACNFKCSYCGPSFSSAWVQELKKHGAYPTSDKFNNLERLEQQGMMPYHANEHNPYVEAFWKWWPDLYKDLHTFRMTGGEPLMHKDVWKILDYIIDNPEPNRELRLGINSNLGVPDELIDKFVEKLKYIEQNNLVKEIVIYTSADTAGNHAEYIRNGLDYEKFKVNIIKIFENCKRVSIIVMSTFNALSIPRYKELLDFVYDCKKKYNSENRYWNPGIMIDSSYLRYPMHQAVNILPEEFIDQVKQLADYADGLRIVDKDPAAEWRAHHMGFTDIEISKIRRIADWMSSEHDPVQIRESRKNFYRFMNAHDERRGTDFKATFPELADFFDMCKQMCE